MICFAGLYFWFLLAIRFTWFTSVQWFWVHQRIVLYKSYLLLLLYHFFLPVGVFVCSKRCTWFSQPVPYSLVPVCRLTAVGSLTWAHVCRTHALISSCHSHTGSCQMQTLKWSLLRTQLSVVKSEYASLLLSLKFDSAISAPSLISFNVIVIMYIYHAFIDALSTHMINIINLIFCTHVEHSPTKSIYI